MLVEKDISEIKIGHFIVKIIDQEENFSLKESGHIKSQTVISYLKSKKIYRLLIDTSKTICESTIDPKEIPTDPLVRQQENLKEAKEIFDESKSIQRQLFQDALSGSTIDLGPVVEITNKSINAIYSDENSLSCMLNIRDKDEYLLEHSVAVSIYITLFARYLGLDRSIIEELSMGAFLHDIGKIKIPDSILNKPGKLTDYEFTIMKTHANHSIDIIKSTPEISALALEVASLHHEKLDGKGYPFQVKGEDISIYGRMISICDIFDALTATRVYKEGYPHDKAFAILRELGKQGQLDSKLVDQFIKCVGVFPVGSLVQLKSNELALVHARNEENPIRPHVQAFYNIKLSRFHDQHKIDLTKSDDRILKGVRPEDFDLDMNQIMNMLLMEG